MIHISKKKILYKDIGVRIKAHRRSLGLTQEELSKKIGVSKNFLGDVERGKKQMSVNTIISVSKALGLSLDYIIYGEENQLYCTPVNEMHPVYGMIQNFDKKTQNSLYEFLVSINNLYGNEIETQQEEN